MKQIKLPTEYKNLQKPWDEFLRYVEENTNRTVNTATVTGTGGGSGGGGGSTIIIQEDRWWALMVC